MAVPQQRLEQLGGHLRPRSAFFDGQTAIITGAAQGIGKATALHFAAEGARVVIVDLDQARADATVKEIEAAGGQALAVCGDLTSADFAATIVDKTVARFGKQIDHIVNCAGFALDKMSHQMTDKAFDLMLNIHLTAPFRLIRAAAPYMRSQDPAVLKTNRCIINVSSQSGVHGQPGQVNYAAAKMGVVGLTKTYAKEYGRFNIRCNAVAFGAFDTRMTRDTARGETIEVGGERIPVGVPGKDKMLANSKGGFAESPLNRRGKVEEAAASIVMLASPLASYVTGITLEVAGGRLL